MYPVYSMCYVWCDRLRARIYTYRRAVVILYYIYVRLVNWTTAQRPRHLDRKTPDVSIGRSCFIGIRTETRNWSGSIELLFLSLFLFFFFLIDRIRLSRTICAQELSR
jgi:hypothetical protein